MSNKRYFRIELYGYGGEIVIGKATEAEYLYWNSEAALTDTGTEDAEDALWSYIEEHESEPERFTVPEEFKREGQWFDQGDLIHDNGVDFAYAHVNVYEVAGPEWDDQQINTVVEDTTLADFIEQYNADTVPNDFEPDDQYVFFGMSSEKGTFYSAVLETDSDIDLSLLKFHNTEYFTGDEIISHITYNDQDLSNEGGDTNGKGMTVKFIEI
jgi:hypothetical protein